MESNLLYLITGEAPPHGAVAFEAHARIRTEISKLLGGSHKKILASPQPGVFSLYTTQAKLAGGPSMILP